MLKMQEKRSLKDRENEFQAAIHHWLEYKDESSWHTMFIRVEDCVHNIAAKKLTNITTDPEDFHEKVLETTCMLMDRIRRGAVPEKLSSWCYLATIGVLYSKKAQWHDKSIVRFSDLSETQEEVVEKTVATNNLYRS